MARSSSSPLVLSGSGSRSGLRNLLKDSSPLRARTKHDIKVRHDVKSGLALKMCNSERVYAISDCLVCRLTQASIAAFTL